MLFANLRNTILFAGGCLALAIALLDDTAPARLTANAERVELARAVEAAGSVQPGPWDSVGDDGGDGPASMIEDITRAPDPLVPPQTAIQPVPRPAAPRAPAPVLAEQAAHPPVPGVRERSAPLGRSHGGDGAGDLAEDLRLALN